MTKQHQRWITLTLAGLGLIAVLGIMLQPAAIEVDHASINRGLLEVTVEEQGRTRARYRHTVAAPVSGRLLRTSVDEGDRVTAGAVLAKIAPPPENSRDLSSLQAELTAAEARRQEAAAGLVEARSQLQLALAEAQRRSALFDQGMVSIETRDIYVQTAAAAKARRHRAEAALAAASADVNSAQARLIGTDGTTPDTALTAVIAPVDGVILRVYEESERVLQAGDPLFDISKGEELEIVVDFLTQDAVKIQPGDRLKVTGWGGDATLSGKVRYVEPGAFTKISTLGVEEQRVNVIADIANPPPALGAEFRVEAAVVIWTGEAVLRVPTTAIFRRGSAWSAFVVREGRAHLQVIEVGHRGSDYAEVISGVGEGEQVILFPSDLVADGVKVKIDG